MHVTTPERIRSRPGWWWLLILGVVAVTASVLVLRRQANTDLSPIVRAAVKPGGPDSKSLIVMVHGYLGSTQNMAHVFSAITNSRPESAVLSIQYNARRFSNADCFQISEQICQEVNNLYTANGYTNIQFVGYSMGSLLARKAYMYGFGRIDDLDPNPESPPGARPPQAWVTNVTRFVLLAGMNRGWTTRTRPSGMSPSRRLAFRVGKFIGWATNTGRVILQTETGEPFVANLRMQWLHVMNAMDRERRPTVIQLLGDTDDVVSAEDSRDVNVARDFIWVQLTATGHENIIDFREEKHGPERQRRFREALGDELRIARLRRMSPTLAEADDTNVVETVVLLHGIRDFGEWTSQFEESLQSEFIAKHPDGGKLYVYRPTYGYFDMLSFLIAPARQSKVRWFMDEMTELQARYPSMTNLHFIGHSHGTYVLASALKKYKALKVGRAVFAGSVVRQDFNWASPSLTNRVQMVRAYAGSADWVVAFFPKLFESGPLTVLNKDIGSAGFNGFARPKGMTEQAWTVLTNSFLFETKYLSGGHGTATENEQDKIKSVVAFAINGEIKHPPEVVPQAGWVMFLSRWCILVWLVVIVVVAGGVFCGTVLLKHLLVRIFAVVSRHPGVLTSVSTAISIGIAVWLLRKF